MDLSEINHIEPDRLSEFQPDVFITALGYENRGTYIAKRLDNLSCRKIALAFKNPPGLFSSKHNQEYFESRGYEIIPVEKGNPDYHHIFGNSEKELFNVIFDSSCMTKHWYFHFLKWLNDETLNIKRGTIRFVYTLSEYYAPPSNRKVKRINHFESPEKENITKKSKALILGLGHEMQVCREIVHMVKPDLLYLFYADPSVDKEFVRQVYINNHQLIESIPIRNLIAYPVFNGLEIYQKLVDVIMPLRNQYNITLISQGPKIFSLVSMIAQMSYPDLTISYPLFKRSHRIDTLPAGDPVILDVSFEDEE